MVIWKEGKPTRKTRWVLILTCLAMWGCASTNPNVAIDENAPDFVDPLPSPTPTFSAPGADDEDPIADCKLDEPICVIDFPLPGESFGLRIRLSTLQLASNSTILSVVIANNSLKDIGPSRIGISGLLTGEKSTLLTAQTLASWSDNQGTLTWTIEAIPSRTSMGPFSVETPGFIRQEDLLVTLNLGKDPTYQIKAHFGMPEDATLGETHLDMSAIENDKFSDFVVRYRDSTGVEQALPLGLSDNGGEASLFEEIAGTGVQYFVPQGELGTVEIKRSHTGLPPGFADDQTALAEYEINKEHPGSVIMVVPLSRPAPPFTLVRVFVDHGDGFYEQPVMGGVTADGLHASFAADGSSTYVLTTSTSELSNGILGVSGLEAGRSDLAGDLNADIAGIEGSLQELEEMAGRIQSQMFGFADANDPGTMIWVSQQSLLSSDADHDGLSYDVELAAGTDPDNADTDGDGAYDGEELKAGTDPNDSNSFPDIGPDDIVAGPGCRSWVCFAPSDGSQADGGGGGSGFPSMDNLPGGGMTAMENVGELAPSLQAMLGGIEDALMTGVNVPPPDNSSSANMSTLGCDLENEPSCLDGSTLMAAIILVDNNLVILIPPHQGIAAIFSPPSAFQGTQNVSNNSGVAPEKQFCTVVKSVTSSSVDEIVVTVLCNSLKSETYQMTIGTAFGVCRNEPDERNILVCSGPKPKSVGRALLHILDSAGRPIFRTMVYIPAANSGKPTATVTAPKPSATAKPPQPTATNKPPDPTVKPPDPTAKPPEPTAKPTATSEK